MHYPQAFGGRAPLSVISIHSWIAQYLEADQRIWVVRQSLPSLPYSLYLCDKFRCLLHIFHACVDQASSSSHTSCREHSCMSSTSRIRLRYDSDHRNLHRFFLSFHIRFQGDFLHTWHIWGWLDRSSTDVQGSSNFYRRNWL